MDDNEWLAAHLADGFSRAFLVDARAAGLPRDGQRISAALRGAAQGRRL